MNDAVVVETNMRKLRTAGAIAHCPDVFSGGFQPLVGLDVSARVELDAGSVETDSVSVRLATSRDENIGALDSAIAVRVVHINANEIAGMSLDAASLGPEQDLD